MSPHERYIPRISNGKVYTRTPSRVNSSKNILHRKSAKCHKSSSRDDKTAGKMAANIAGMAFVPYYNHLVKLLDTDEDLKKTAKGIFHQMAYSAGGAVVGGMIAGPPGGLVGGIAGAVMGYMTVDPYENMIKVIRSLDSEQQKDLVTKIQELVGSTGIEALTSFVAQQVNREIFMNVVKEFVKNATKGG